MDNSSHKIDLLDDDFGSFLTDLHGPFAPSWDCLDCVLSV